MRVLLDDHPLPDQPTLAAALRAASAQAQRAGRVVVEAFLDGAQVPDDILEDPSRGHTGAELKLLSVSPHALVKVTLADAAEALESAAQDQRRCADLIQSGKVDECLTPLSTAIETWQAVRDAVEKGSAILQMPLDSMTIPLAGTPERLPDLIGSLTARLEEIRRSLSAQDWSGLADVMAYDMAEQAERWKEVLETLAAAIKSE